MSVALPSLLAAFVWPSLFYAGAAAVSLPILIHLFARRRFQRLRWAAMEFLLLAEKANRRRVRLEDLILLLLRCLAVFLIGLLLARPFLRPQGLAALLGGSERTERIFVLDDSFSMGFGGADGEAFVRAKRAAVRLIEMLREHSPEDSVTVLLTSAVTQPVAAGVYLDPKQTDELFARLEALGVSQRGLACRDMINALRKSLDEQPQLINVVLYVISDFQRKDWVDSRTAASDTTAAGSPSDASPIAELAAWRTQGAGGGAQRSLQLTLVDVGDDHARNLAVTHLQSAQARLVANVSADVNVTVANYSNTATGPINLDVTLGPAPQPTVAVPDVTPGNKVEVALSVLAPTPGWQWITASTPQDGLPADDRRALALQTVEALRVLIVDGEPSSDPYRDEVTLLRTALRPPGDVFSGNEVSVIDETTLAETTLDSFQLVILANVYRVGESTVQEMQRFVSRGGGLAIFLGDQVDAEAYNAAFFSSGEGLLPALLGERLTAPAAGVPLVPDDELHPVVRIFAGTENPFRDQILFHQYYAATPYAPPDPPEDITEPPPAESGADAERAASSLPSSPPPARVIAHFNDAESTPAVIERPYGAGQVLLFTSSCDQEWNDWAKDPSYVVCMLEMMQHLARGQGAAADLLVGEALDLRLDTNEYAPDVLLRTPRYPAEQEIAVAATPAADGTGYGVRWEQTESQGIYQFLLTNLQGEQEARVFAVNLDPAESDLTPATETDLRRSLREMPFTYVSGLESLDLAGEEARRELWKTVLWTAFAVLMFEQTLGWWFSRRA